MEKSISGAYSLLKSLTIPGIPLATLYANCSFQLLFDFLLEPIICPLAAGPLMQAQKFQVK